MPSVLTERLVLTHFLSKSLEGTVTSSSISSFLNESSTVCFFYSYHFSSS